MEAAVDKSNQADVHFKDEKLVFFNKEIGLCAVGGAYYLGK
jgi:23S rRNA-/tRNA-specific pseudouridylate synthase